MRLCESLSWTGWLVANGASRRGIQRERDLVQILRRNDYFAIRAPGSLGCADVIAMKRGEPSLLVELKSTSRSAFAGFPPADRAELLEVAARSGAEAWLVYWPKRSEPIWISPDEWPPTDMGTYVPNQIAPALR
jgi:Holliday junction resolvase